MGRRSLDRVERGETHRLHSEGWRRSIDTGSGSDDVGLSKMFERGRYARAYQGWTIVLAALLSLAVPVAAGPLEDANAAYVRGDYATALALTRPLAEQGAASAQVSIGAMYSRGEGVPVNYAEAVRWYRRAAETGDAAGQAKLGLMFLFGLGVPRDVVEAANWFRKAADQGSVDAQFHLGAMYREGEGVPQDYSESLMWYRRAAEQGLANAQSIVGNVLGGIYSYGEGIQLDYVQAYKWLDLASARYPELDDVLHDVAINNRDLISAKMTQAEIAEARRLAREWKPKQETSGW